METEIFKVNMGVKDSSFSQTALFSFTVFAVLLWFHVTVSAGPPTPKIENDRRTPLSEQLLDPSKGWRNPEQPKNPWREEKNPDEKEKKSRIESKRFKPYYYDPQKEGDIRDPYSSRPEENANPKPPTFFRFQF